MEKETCECDGKYYHENCKLTYRSFNKKDKFIRENKWYPVEIAPLNEPILVYQPPLKKEFTGAYFVAVLLDEPYLHWKGRDWLHPTHWMRLPEPPENIEFEEL